jgi:hypothetical protein
MVPGLAAAQFLLRCLLAVMAPAGHSHGHVTASALLDPSWQMLAVASRLAGLLAAGRPTARQSASASVTVTPTTTAAGAYTVLTVSAPHADRHRSRRGGRSRRRCCRQRFLRRRQHPIDSVRGLERQHPRRRLPARCVGTPRRGRGSSRATRRRHVVQQPRRRGEPLQRVRNRHHACRGSGHSRERFMRRFCERRHPYPVNPRGL